MNKYDIVARPDGSGFNVSIVSGNGARQSVLGFATQLEAQAWIAQDQRLSGVADPFQPQGGGSGEA